MANTLEQEASDFDALYQGQSQSPTLRRIFRETLGLSGLDWAIAPYSFVNLADLKKISLSLNLKPGHLLADIGCGNGSIGLWLAQQNQARLMGVDVSSEALALARKKAAQIAPGQHSEFSLGGLEASGLSETCADAVVSIDAIWLATDQKRALKEMARILKPGGRLVFASWEQHINLPIVKQPVSDYRPLLAHAGFEVLEYAYLRHSEPLQASIYAQVRAEQDVLRAEIGDAIQGLIDEAHFVPGLVNGINYISQDNGPHVLVCATRM